MRLTRNKVVNNMKRGESLTLKKISEPEFLVYAKKELPALFAEAVTQKSYDKFADILEIVHATLQLLEMDWYECTKVKSSKRWENGVYDNFVACDSDLPDQES